MIQKLTIIHILLRLIIWAENDSGERKTGAKKRQIIDGEGTKKKIASRKKRWIRLSHDNPVHLICFATRKRMSRPTPAHFFYPHSTLHARFIVYFTQSRPLADKNEHITDRSLYERLVFFFILISLFFPPACWPAKRIAINRCWCFVLTRFRDIWREGRPRIFHTCTLFSSSMFIRLSKYASCD